ncbi:hypothetical protein AXG93_2982s1000 [Marchantia polymorpha subsp. ruderalis]|uniref:Uncharacterized protein n=1 Tax=Marchantia polymorpha subsp. ruderalis TaxID=1480154 RepID=A0A176VXP7_MARPO|nr:hypothetical protein AXG93_2982s1000 [Marchantia polymorpha subsp. ruderalis]
MRRKNNRKLARGEVLRRHAFGAARTRLSRQTTAEIKFNSCACYTAADDSAEATANWIARILARADCSETRFPLVGMELGVLGYGPRVAEGQGRTTRSTSAAEAEVGRRSGVEPATRCCCFQSKAATNKALQLAQAEGSQARPAGKQRRDGACCREKKLAILGEGCQEPSAQAPSAQQRSEEEPSAQRTSG